MFIGLFAYVAIAGSSVNAQNVERIEPPFWWTGFKVNELQLLLYGEDISNYRITLDHPGVKLKEVVNVESPNYLFIYLDITHEAQPGVMDITFRDKNNGSFVVEYELKQRDPGAFYHEGFDSSDAIYLLMPDRFANGNPAIDNVAGMLEKSDRNDPVGRHGGDIQGIIDNLDYIADMGFTAIWHNPVLENNQPNYSYHGYAITDFYKVDARLGTNEDYLRLIREAEERGVGIIKDMIFNHCGSKHWWMDDLPTSDWINQWDEFTRTSYRGTTIVDPHAAEADFDLMNRGWFDRHMPDLNQENRLLADYLIQNSLWWIEYSGISGIRVDTQFYPCQRFMADWGWRVMYEYPYFNIVGEAWLPKASLVSYFQGGKLNHDGYNSHIPSVFDFPLYDAVINAFNEEHSWNKGLIKLYDALAEDFLYPDPYSLVVFGDNHDTDRLFTSLNENIRSLELVITFLATTRGIPLMYYGTEILMTGLESSGHGYIREDFPGGWEDDKVNSFNRTGRSNIQNRAHDFISMLFNYRKQREVLHYGYLKHFVPENNVYVYFRYNDNETIMVVLNNSEQDQVIELSRFAEAINGFSSGSDIISNRSYKLEGTWEIPAKTPMVLDLY